MISVENVANGYPQGFPPGRRCWTSLGPKRGQRRVFETSAGDARGRFRGPVSGHRPDGGCLLESSIGAAAHLQFFAGLRDLGWGCEHFGPQILTGDLVTKPLRFADFHSPADGPGLGVTLDPEQLRRSARDSRSQLFDEVVVDEDRDPALKTFLHHTTFRPPTSPSRPGALCMQPPKKFHQAR
jgi:hypothetical protein